MSKYVFLYYIGENGLTQEDMESMDDSVMEAWGKWFESMGSNLVDGGNPFAPGGTYVDAKGESGAIESWPATGYSIVNAENMEAAQEIAKGCPMLENNPDGVVRVFEALPM